jgi:ferrochelatase
MTDDAKTTGAPTEPPSGPATPTPTPDPSPAPTPATAPDPGPTPAAAPSPAAAPAQPAPLALILLDIGAPENEADVSPFLKRLYADRHVLQMALAGLFLDVIAWGISLSRRSAVTAALKAVGGTPPERAQLIRLSEALALGLSGRSGATVQGYVAFRHAEPGIAKVLAQAREAGCKRAVALFARTFASSAGSESMRAELSICAEESGGVDVSMIDGYEEDPGVRKALAAQASAALSSLPEDQREGAHLLFVLQAQPVRAGTDPTLPRALAFAETVREAMGAKNMFSVAYQSGVDPRAALLPQATEEIDRIGAEKRSALVLIPISQACEGMATGWELDQVLVPHARQAGISHVARARAPAEAPEFRAALEDLLARHLAEMERLRTA